MINKEKIFCNTWNSCDEIDNIVDYINTLPLQEPEFKNLEKLFKILISHHSGMQEEIMGEDA